MDTKKLNLSDEVRESIEQLIFDGVLRPDQRMIQDELANRLGVSRTPLREALRQLEIKGYLTKTKSGYTVTYFTNDDIAEIFDIREALEVLAIKLACDRITQEQIEKITEYCLNYSKTTEDTYLEGTNWNNMFHNEIYNASGNKRLINYIQSLRDIVFLKHASKFMSNKTISAFGQDHYAILDAIMQRDKQMATEAVI